MKEATMSSLLTNKERFIPLFFYAIIYSLGGAI